MDSPPPDASFGAQVPPGTPAWDLDAEWAATATVIPGFAGYHFDPDTREYVVSVSRPERAASARDWVRSRLAADGRDVESFRTRVVPHAFDELKRWKDAMAYVLDTETYFWLDIDEVQNQLVFGVRSLDAETRLREVADSAGVPQEAVGLVESTLPEPRQSIDTRIRPTEGGFRIQFLRSDGLVGGCTLGFNAYRMEVSGFVTNSHCSHTKFGLDATIQYQSTYPLSNDRIGVELVDPSTPRTSDAAFFGYDAFVDHRWGHIARTLFPAVNQPGSTSIDPSHPRFRITGKASNAVQVSGSLVNKVGQISGWTQGQVLQTCVSLTGLPCQWVARVWSQQGDSGSPMFQQVGPLEPAASEVALWGILWGGPGTDWTTTWYSPISGVEQDLGTLQVACPPHPTPCDPPLFASIAGPTFISQTGTYSWTASAWGGNGTYSFVWERRINHSTFTCTFQTPWTQVGTGPSYQGSVFVPDYDFELRVSVTSGAQAASKTQKVTPSQHNVCPT